ncbi:MAG: adenylate/guanylate cyclase domain-containing protein, partial [Acetobacteraceae bacterium]|nr:adenylate/guanylate cyclase domain-containing protein [Acetobacteraceae bacterium]
PAPALGPPSPPRWIARARPAILRPADQRAARAPRSGRSRHRIAMPAPAPLPAQGDLLAAELALTRWITGFALAHDDPAALLAGFCERVVEAGVPLLRMGIAANVVHPLLQGRGYNWRRGEAVERADLTRAVARRRDAVWRRSPFYALQPKGPTELRRTLGGSYKPGEFTMLDEFVGRGCTDYVAMLVPYGRDAASATPSGMLLSVQTDRAGGFANAELDLLRRLAQPLAHACKTMTAVEAGRTLMATYLGRDPARQVLEGRIEQGRAEPVQAVLWSSDLVGFTRIADTLPRDRLLELLNAYADAVVASITAQGGEVLKFIGDGIIAIFPLAAEGGPEGACARALDAAQAALVAVEALGATRASAGLSRTGLHLALHLGEVLYGNIGSRERLDFTVVGPAVNEVARIEAMCRSLDQRLVVSSAVAAAAGPARARLVSLGRYALRGVGRPQELFTLDRDATSPR